MSSHNARSRGVRTIQVVRVDFRKRELEAKLLSRGVLAPMEGDCTCWRCQNKRSGVTLPVKPDRIIHMTIRNLHRRWTKEKHVTA